MRPPLRETAARAPGPRTFDPTVWRVVGDPLVPPLGDGPLSGETVAVKDIFAVAGQAIGFGVPAYLAGAPVQHKNAVAVDRLVRAGASVRGIAQMDQFAYSLAGDNPHYGMPVNPAVPGGLPGGSSSGSATAVSLGAASLGLGTDTGGSVRVPASYQGLWGLRTTHGRVPADGLLPMAPDFDTVGLFARDSGLLARAASALLASGERPEVGAVIGPEALDGLNLAELAEAFRIHQGFQAWAAHGRWLSDHPGAVLGAPATRFKAAAQITAAEDARAIETLRDWRERLDLLLGRNVLTLPSASSPAPLRWAPAEDIDAVRAATFRLTCVAGVTGRPALSAPLEVTEHGPVGTCFIGPRDSDLVMIERAGEDRG